MPSANLVALRCKCYPPKSVLCRTDDPRLRAFSRCPSCRKNYTTDPDAAPDSAWWAACTDSARMTDALALLGTPVSARKLRLGACYVCRTEFDWCRNPRFLEAVAAGEAFADHDIDDDKREEAYQWLLRTSVRVDPTCDWFSAGLRCVLPEGGSARGRVRAVELPADWFREAFGDPFDPVKFDPNWRTDTVVMLARSIVTRRTFDLMPVLSDALMDAGCEDVRVIEHCRSSRPHARGCWVLDAILGKT